MASSLLNDKSINRKWRVLAKISLVLFASVIFNGIGWAWKNDFVTYTVHFMQLGSAVFLLIINWFYYNDRKAILAQQRTESTSE